MKSVSLPEQLITNVPDRWWTSHGFRYRNRGSTMNASQLLFNLGTNNNCFSMKRLYLRRIPSTGGVKSNYCLLFKALNFWYWYWIVTMSLPYLLYRSIEPVVLWSINQNALSLINRKWLQWPRLLVRWVMRCNFESLKWAYNEGFSVINRKTMLLNQTMSMHSLQQIYISRS